MTKKEQLHKNKMPNPKRMSKAEKFAYENFIHDRANGICQVCGSRPIDEYHHSKRGAYKDDRSIVGICRPCHSLIHNCEHKHYEETARLTEIAKQKGEENWSVYAF